MGACGSKRIWASAQSPLASRVSTSMSRKNRNNKRRRSQANLTENGHIEHDTLENGAQAVDVVEKVEGSDADAVDDQKVEEGQADGEEQPAESEEELKRKQEIWDVFSEEHHEGMPVLYLHCPNM